MSKPVMTIPESRVEQYDKLVATEPTVARKGATMPYTSVNGNMFSFLAPSGALALRLPEDARQAFIRKHKTKLFMQHGAAFSEYVVVPEALWKKPGELTKHFGASYAYAKTLKPKPSKKVAAKKRTARPKR